MRRQSERERLFVSQWYIGAGNKVSVFTRRSRKPFEKVKEHYKKEIDKLPQEKEHWHQLDPHEQQMVREHIRQQLRKEKQEEIRYFIFISLLSLLAFAALVLLIRQLAWLIRFYG